MKMKLLILSVFAMICAGHTSAQNLSNKGRDFWVGYGHHQFMEQGTNSMEMVLYLSAEQAANVTVTINGTPYVRNYAIPAGTVTISETIPKAGVNDARLYSLPCTFVPPGFPCGGEGLFVRHAIHIVSDVPIVAYAHIYGSASSGATMLMPVETWGYNYVTLNSKQNYAADCFSWAYIIAERDGTVVEITPTVATRGGSAANVPFTVSLNRGQIYQFMAGPGTGNPKNELSGTKIKSIANAAGQCYPIAVFSGSSRTFGIPVSCGAASGGDNDNQQCFPSQAWGKRYLTAPTSNSNTASTPMFNTFKIAVKDPATQVRRDGILLTGLIANSYYEYTTNAPSYITADKPVMVAQYMHSGTACQGGSGVGDPEMMYISPIEQGIKRIGFYRNTNQGITVNYLTLIIPTAGVASLTIDGSSVFNHTYPHPQLPGYTVVVKRWAASQAQAIAQSDSAFTAITYGLGSVESYGYNAGTLINNLNAVGSIFNPSDNSGTTTQHPFTCTNTPVQLSVLLAYQPTKIVWQLSQVGGGLTPNADVTDNAPVQVGPPVLISGVNYYKYTLPGNYSFTTTGSWNVPILTTHPSVENCTNTEQLGFLVEVRGKPQPVFNFTHTGCIADPVSFSSAVASANGFNINQWTWTMPNGTTYNSQNATHLFTAPGTQNVSLNVVSTEGCVSDSVRAITIYPRPTGAFTVNPTGTICEDGTYTFTGATSYAGTAPLVNHYWDFGNGLSSGAGPHTITYPNYGTYTVRHASGVSTSCMSDTAERIVTVYDKPTTTFSIPAGCLSSNNTVQFTSAASTQDGQAITGHLWTFGDPGSGAANTSTSPNPTHTYPGYGTYTVTYRATTANTCFKDTTAAITFNFAAALSYPVLTAVCENAPAFSVANATVTNGVPGTGVYSGPGTNGAGQFDPATAGPGTHTITYTFTSATNCVSTVTQTITVNAKPDPNFSIAGSGCLPPSGTVNFSYTGVAQPGQTYAWNFGDPGSGPNNTSTVPNPTHNYTSGTYNITLTVTNSNNCVEVKNITQAFTVTPALNYPALAPVCVSAPGTVSVATATVTNGVAGSGVYSGPGTDASGNFNPSAAGPGTHLITYTFTSASGSCVATATQNIVVNPKPNASFSINPPGPCISASGQVQFTYNGSLSAGQTYLYNFDDPNASGGNPNTATSPNPTHVFIGTGTYDLTLTVTDANGCFDDTVISRILDQRAALSYPPLAPVCVSATGTISVATATVTNGVPGLGTYVGPGTDPAGIFDPVAAGPGTHTITYAFTTSGNCTDFITQTITVRPKPNASFTYSPLSGCLNNTGDVQFTYNGSLSAGQTYSWNFGDPASGSANTSTLQNPTHSFAAGGSYGITLTVTDANGCLDDTLITRNFNLTPALSFPALPQVCQSAAPLSIATAVVTNGVPGTGIYSGPGTNAAGIFDPAVAGAGTHTITYTFTSGAGCFATVTQTITVSAKPNASFTYTPQTACLPTTGQVQFTYNGSLSAGQTYLWDFDDPNAGAGNPNTSVLQNPTHNFTNTGSYDLTLTVTNTAGCFDDTVITRTLSVTPALAFAPIPAVCENATGTISVANAVVTNNVTGTGVYSGPGTSSSGSFNPAAAGSGTHTITYTFTSTANCIATITSTVTVNPEPQALFTATTGICQDQSTQITSNATIASGTITTWQWNFGDNNIVTYTNGNPFTYNYAQHGNYTITLTTTSNAGCVDTYTQNVLVHAVPAANFALPGAICLPNPAVFQNSSAIADGATLSYAWTFGDGGTSSDLNPSHIYAAPGTYPVTLTVTSSFGCSDVTSQTISSFFTKPLAAFSVNPREVCEGKPVSFTDGSSAPGSSISSHLWLFGDGTTSNAPNPSKTYGDPGYYEVKLVVRNAQGCASDTARDFVRVHLQPEVDAGRSFVVAQGTRIQFEAASNSTGLNYSWSPATGLSDATVLRPSLTANADETYRITATGSGSCTATDFLTVKILRPVKPVNAFSPNGDGYNDTWIIENLSDYPGATVEVYNRYGQIVFNSAGYSKPWDGTYNGRPLPVATYYYIITLSNGYKPLNGSITIIR